MITAGSLDRARTEEIRAIPKGSDSEGSDLSSTVHAPMEIDLFDLRSAALHRRALESSVGFAGGIGAPIVVVHAGHRHAAREARTSLTAQLAAGREVARV